MRIFGADNRLDSNRGRSLAQVIPDPGWPKHGSGAMPGRDLSDMVNLRRAKDAAVTLALAELNGPIAAWHLGAFLQKMRRVVDSLTK
jgi:hypothetical protein